MCSSSIRLLQLSDTSAVIMPAWLHDAHMPPIRGEQYVLYILIREMNIA